MPVADNSSSGSRGPLRLLYDWLIGPLPSSDPDFRPAAAGNQALPSRIGHYAIARKLGEGGMGVVYDARDERLERAASR